MAKAWDQEAYNVQQEERRVFFNSLYRARSEDNELEFRRLLKANPERMHKFDGILSYLIHGDENLKYVKVAIECGANVNQSYNNNIMIASLAKLECMKILIEAGLNLNPGHPIRPPIFNAIVACNFDVVKLLIDHGADINYEYKYYPKHALTPLATALTGGWDLRKSIQLNEIADYLRKIGAKMPEENMSFGVKSESLMEEIYSEMVHHWGAGDLLTSFGEFKIYKFNISKTANRIVTCGLGCKELCPPKNEEFPLFFTNAEFFVDVPKKWKWDESPYGSHPVNLLRKLAELRLKGLWMNAANILNQDDLGLDVGQSHCFVTPNFKKYPVLYTRSGYRVSLLNAVPIFPDEYTYLDKFWPDSVLKFSSKIPNFYSENRKPIQIQ